MRPSPGKFREDTPTFLGTPPRPHGPGSPKDPCSPASPPLLSARLRHLPLSPLSLGGGGASPLAPPSLGSPACLSARAPSRQVQTAPGSATYLTLPPRSPRASLVFDFRDAAGALEAAAAPAAADPRSARGCSPPALLAASPRRAEDRLLRQDSTVLLSAREVSTMLAARAARAADAPSSSLAAAAPHGAADARQAWHGGRYLRTGLRSTMPTAVPAAPDAGAVAGTPVGTPGGRPSVASATARSARSPPTAARTPPPSAQSPPPSARAQAVAGTCASPHQLLRTVVIGMPAASPRTAAPCDASARATPLGPASPGEGAAAAAEERSDPRAPARLPGDAGADDSSGSAAEELGEALEERSPSNSPRQTTTALDRPRSSSCSSSFASSSSLSSLDDQDDGSNCGAIPEFGGVPLASAATALGPRAPARSASHGASRRRLGACKDGGRGRDGLAKTWQCRIASPPGSPSVFLQPLDLSKVHKTTSTASDTATGYGAMDAVLIDAEGSPRAVPVAKAVTASGSPAASPLRQAVTARAATARAASPLGEPWAAGFAARQAAAALAERAASPRGGDRGLAGSVAPGDVMITLTSGRLEQLGAVGGFMGHALLITGRPRAVARGSREAGHLGAVFALAPGAQEVWCIRTLESTRSERTLHHSEALLWVTPEGKAMLIGERSLDGRSVFSSEEPCQVNLWQSPPELAAQMRDDLLQEVVAEMTAQEAGWSLATAARALLFSSRLSGSRSDEDRLMTEIRSGWVAKPICTTVVIAFWQRYLCRLGAGGQPGTPSPSDSILRFIPLRADRALPGELLQAMAACGWRPADASVLSAGRR